MKKVLPYIFLLTIALPQLSLIGKLIYVSKIDKTCSLLVFENEEDLSEEDNSEDSKSETESKTDKEVEAKKKTWTYHISFNNQELNAHSHNNFYYSYINHYDFSYSNIRLQPPKQS